MKSKERLEDGEREWDLHGLLVRPSGDSTISAALPALRCDTSQLISLGKITVLYGLNGAGKSSILDAINMAASFSCSPLEGLVFQISGDARDRIGAALSAYCSLFPDETVPIDEVEFNRVDGILGTGELEGLRFTFKDVAPLWEEWAREGLVLVAPSRDGVWRSCVPILRNSLDDHPKSFRVLSEIRVAQQALAESRVSVHDFGALNRRDYPNVAAHLRPGLNPRNLPLRATAFIREILDIPVTEEDNSFFYLNPLPLLEMLENLSNIGRQSAEAVAELPTLHLELIPAIQSIFTQLIATFFTVSNEDISVKRLGPRKDLDRSESNRSRLIDTYLAILGNKESAISFDGAQKIASKFLLPLAKHLFPSWESLELQWGDERERLRGYAPRWIVNGGFQIDSVSEAQARWLELFSQLLSSPTHEGLIIYLLDEPELGLHRQAEFNVEKVVKLLSTTSPFTVIATHSPALLDIEGAKVFHVRNGKAEDLSFRNEALLEAGLHPSDLVGMHRGFLLVEGPHDKLVLEHFLGHTLELRRIKVVQAGGGSQFPGSINVLLNFSSAPVVIVADNLRHDEVQQAWTIAKSTVKADKYHRSQKGMVAIKGIELAQSKGAAEDKFIRSTMDQILKTEEYERVYFYGLSKPDIEFYLPESAFGLNKTWEQFHDDYKNWKQQIRKQPRKSPSEWRAFKTWLSDSNGNRIVNEGSILKALKATQDTVPPEFIRLAEFIEQI